MRRSMVVSLVAVVFVAVASLGATVAAGNSPQLGLDLQGGASVVLRPKEGTRVASGVLDQAIEIIRSRVDALGVSEPDISRQGSSIIVQLPGVKNRDRALEIVGQTAQLLFRPVLEELPFTGGSTASTTTTTVAGTTTTAAGPTTTAAGPTTTAAGPTTTAAGATATTTPGSATTTTLTAGEIPTTPPEQDDPAKEVVLPSSKDRVRYRLGPAEVTGRALSSARAVIDPNTGVWEVTFDLTSEGTGQWNAMAEKIHPRPPPQNRIAIDLDGDVKTAPALQQANFPGSGRITGNFTEREAKDLALVLRYGALPVQLERQTVQTVSASLGRDSLRAGIVAGVVGLALVALYMLLYYRALGIVVWLGLLVTGALMYSVVTFLGETRGLALSLAGATGIIVSVGVTVDSYVVYFERLKDEIRSGKTVRSSVGRSFSRAYRTILAADAASFIGAVILYWLSVGSVRGFAFFLGLSTLLDVFIAYFFTRPMVAILGRSRFFTEARWVGVARGLAAPPATPAPATVGAGPPS